MKSLVESGPQIGAVVASVAQTAPLLIKGWKKSFFNGIMTISFETIISKINFDYYRVFQGRLYNFNVPFSVQIEQVDQVSRALIDH